MKIVDALMVVAILAAWCTPLPASAKPTEAAATNPRLDGPKALIITYHVAPKNRLAFRRAVEAGNAPSAQLKLKGKITEYQHLWNRYVDDQSWTMTTFLQFASAKDFAAWRQIEEHAPAGLSPQALALVERVISTPADLIREHHAAKTNAESPVFLVLPYDYLISTDSYVAYADGYVLKQANEWIREGVLDGYQFYIARYGSMRPWSSLLVLQYRGEAGLAARESVMDKSRKALASDPEFSEHASSKANIREARTVTVADPINRRSCHSHSGC